MQRIELELAYVLHRRAYRNTSWIVEFLTQQHGRITAVARSARGLSSRYRGKIELFVPMQISWVGRGELKSLGQVDFSALPIVLDGDALMCGFYVNELVMRLLHRDDPHPQVFDEYASVLIELRDTDSVEIPLRRFEKRLLDHLGYGLPLTRECRTGAEIEVQHHYQYLPEEGFLRIGASSMQARQTFSGASLVALATEQWDNAQTLLESKRLMRMVLARYMGERGIKSRELLQRGGRDEHDERNSFGG